MRYKITKNGKEINIIEASEAFVKAYCKDNGFAYEESPLPPQPEPEPTPKTPTEEEDIAAMTLDHEYRLTLLEMGLSAENIGI